MESIESCLLELKLDSTIDLEATAAYLAARSLKREKTISSTKILLLMFFGGKKI